MKTKEIGQILDVFECVQLLDKAVEYGIYQRDREENIVVYRYDVGWCSVPIVDCAYELSFDLTGQTFIRESLKRLGIELNNFLEFQKAENIMGW